MTIIIIIIILILLTGLYLFIYRPWQLNWGAHPIQFSHRILRYLDDAEMYERN